MQKVKTLKNGSWSSKSDSSIPEYFKYLSLIMYLRVLEIRFRDIRLTSISIFNNICMIYISISSGSSNSDSVISDFILIIYIFFNYNKIPPFRLGPRNQIQWNLTPFKISIYHLSSVLEISFSDIYLTLF